MFGNLGEMAGLMKKAKVMQENMKKAQEEVAQMEVNGSSGGGQIEVIVTGDFIIKSIKINPECLDSSDPELLEDLVLTAVNNAVNEAKIQAQGKMSEVTSGINIPGLTS